MANERGSTNAGIRVLVLGAYGFIGSSAVRALLSKGFRVCGAGRNSDSARRAFHDLEWKIFDLGKMRSRADWINPLKGVDIVVNCAGALQDSPADQLEQLHHKAIATLAEACAERNIRIIQISSAGADKRSAVPFLSTKARGDDAIRRSNARYVIIRPGLVIGRDAYGGTALLRMLAAIPVIQPLSYSDTRMQTVSMTDLSTFIISAASGEVPDGTEVDLVEEDSHSLLEIVAKIRHWLRFHPAFFTLNIPRWMSTAIGKGADVLGLLGWRSPLRTNAQKIMAGGVLGNYPHRKFAACPQLKSLDETLASFEATTADQMAARMNLLMPGVMITLFGFWAVSGIIGLVQLEAAAIVLIDRGWSDIMSNTAVIAGSFVDLVLAAMISLRKYAATACLLMIAVSIVYLVTGTILTQNLWLDPLGPLVKIIPAAALAVIGYAMMRER